MKDDREITPDFVRETILRGFDPAGDWLLEGEPIRARVSTIFKAVSPRSGQTMAIKLYRPGARPGIETAHERRLRRIRAVMEGSTRLTVPRPLGAIPQHRALLMEWIEEPQVSRLLARAGSRRKERARLFEVAGRWLRYFHDCAGARPAPLDVGRLRKDIRAMLGGADAGEVRDGAFRRRHDDLLRHAHAFEGLPVAHAEIHGDFNPNNLLHGSARTVGIDLGLTPPSPVTSDIGRFLVQAETAKPFLGMPFGLGPLGSEKWDLQAFMAGYGAVPPGLDQRQFAFLILAEVLRRWATFLGIRPSAALDIGRHVKRHRLARMAKAAAGVVSGAKGGR